MDWGQILIAGVSAGLAVAAVGLTQHRPWQKLGSRLVCPKCGTDVPAYRKPMSWRQVLWGGWTCLKCGCDSDRHGNRIER
jgi:hypothetical protein